VDNPPPWDKHAHNDMGVDPVEKEWGDLKPNNEHTVVKKV
jgi:hypothetical protein